MPRPLRHGTTIVLLLPLLLTASCSGSGDDQSSPQSLTAAVYKDLHAGHFQKACALVSPAALKRITDTGSDCASYIADHVDGAKRASYIDVKVDAKAIQVNGDTAVVPESAVTFGGQPSSDGDDKVILLNGKWFAAN